MFHDYLVLLNLVPQLLTPLLGLYSIAIIIFPEVTPDNKKSMIAGIIGIVIAVAGVLGPVIGGLLTHYASWRWVFWIK